MKSLDKIFSDFFKQLDIASEKISLMKKKINIKKSKIIHTNQIPKPEINDSTFFPDIIKSDIDNNATYIISYKANIRDKGIVLHFVIFDDDLDKITIDKYDNYANKVFIWFYFIQDYTVTNSCSDNVNIFIYFTKFTKNLPQNQIFTLDCIHVNTGFAHVCRKDKYTDIVVFREEEWFKVILHETFHNFGLDFSTLNNDPVNKKLTKLFNVNIEFNFFEAYCDTWARIMNCVLYTHLNNSNQLNKLYRYLEKEKYFSLYQACKILNFMDLNYDLITIKNESNINICSHLYRENTSVFTYYIITSIFMFNYDKFIDWCEKNNMYLFNFKKTPGNIESFFELLKKLYLLKPFKLCVNENLRILNDTKKINVANMDNNDFIMLNSLRMTILE